MGVSRQHQASKKSLIGSENLIIRTIQLKTNKSLRSRGMIQPGHHNPILAKGRNHLDLTQMINITIIMINTSNHHLATEAIHPRTNTTKDRINTNSLTGINSNNPTHLRQSVADKVDMLYHQTRILEAMTDQTCPASKMT